MQNETDHTDKKRADEMPTLGDMTGEKGERRDIRAYKVGDKGGRVTFSPSLLETKNNKEEMGGREGAV